MTTKKYSEGEVSRALRELDHTDLELYVYKPNDGPGPTQNWKPCDFLVWWAYDLALQPGQRTLGAVISTWIEVKSTPNQGTAAVKLWRPSQVQGMRDAARVGIDYLTVIHWPKRKTWTIGPARIALAAIDAGVVSLPMTAWPIESSTGQLAQHLRAALLGEW